MAKAFIKGAEEAGHSVKVMRTAELDIGGCKGCKGCWETGGNCVFDDDMKQVQETLERADVLVMAAPMYWSVVPSEMKAVIDRIYQYDPIHGGKHLSIGEAVLLACGETENTGDFDMIKEFFRGFAEFNGMKVRDMLTAEGVEGIGDIRGKDILEKAEKLGREI